MYLHLGFKKWRVDYVFLSTDGFFGLHLFNIFKVALDGKVVMISAGDSHSAALTEDGRVFAWGTFRDSSGIDKDLLFKRSLSDANLVAFILITGVYISQFS